MTTGCSVVILIAAMLTPSGLSASGAGGAGPRARSAAAQAARGGARRPPPPAPGSDGADLASEVSTGELVNMLDAWAIVQAQQALALDDTQYGAFVTRLKRLQETRRRGQRERNQILQDLRKLAGAKAQGPVDEATVRERLRTLREHDDRTAGEMRKAYDALDASLTVQQQARFRILEETIERRKMDLLVRARARAAGRGAP